MKVKRTLRTLFSFIIAFAMVLPVAAKAEADVPTYPVDQNALVLEADFTGTSTNEHTFAKAIWTYGDSVYLMVDATHDVKSIKLTSGSGSITSSTPIVHGYTVIVGDTTYKANESKGNVKDSHLTVFKFSLNDVLNTLKLNEGGIYTIDVVSFQGEGHWIKGGTLTIYIPKAQVEISKTWQDGPKDGVSIQLYRKLKNAADSTYVPYGEAFTLTTANPSKTIPDLNYTDNIGRIYSYTAKEVNIGEGYTSVVTVSGPDLVGRVQVFKIAIKNTYTPPLMDIKVTKVWKGEIPSDPLTTITYELYVGNATEYKETGKGTSTDWNYTFKGQPKTNLDGSVITYSVKELPVPGYSTSIDGFTVTNVRSAKRDVDVEKIWKDGDDPSGRPKDGVTFNLLANLVKVDSVVLTSAKNWKHTFKNVESFDVNGIPISYTVTEETVTGFTPTINGFTITNLRTGILNIEGEKTWYDEDKASRPDFITVLLMRNDKEVDRVDVKEEEGLWTYSFTKLPEFDDKGAAYVYEIEELPVVGYKTTILGYDLKNVRTGLVDVSGEKTWDDLMRRPESITINLLQNGVEIDDVSVTKDSEGKWKYSFKALPEFNEVGISYKYSVTEDVLAGYKPTVTGYNIMNRQLRGTLHIMKTDDLNAPLKDVTFEIDDTNGVLIYRGTTDKDGMLKVTLPLGTYIVRETYAPEGYIMDDKDKKITIDEDGETVKLTVVNVKEIEDVGQLPDTGPKPKPVLPKTGAESTFIWYGMGAMLALAGFTLLRKKKTSL